MSVESDIFDALSALDILRCVDDTTERTANDDGSVFQYNDAPSVVFFLVDDTPDIPLRGDIAALTERWQVSIRCTDLANVRAARRAVRDALHGLSAKESIRRCDFDNSNGPTLEDGEPPAYHVAMDFLILS